MTFKNIKPNLSHYNTSLSDSAYGVYSSYNKRLGYTKTSLNFS